MSTYNSDSDDENRMYTYNSDSDGENKIKKQIDFDTAKQIIQEGKFIDLMSNYIIDEYELELGKLADQKNRLKRLFHFYLFSVYKAIDIFVFAQLGAIHAPFFYLI
jgi:hypothetical protein